jgi:response regulator RpfG family c-di-GMP phosphodiesterase
MDTDKILFVDDETHLLEALVRQLRGSFTIVTAASGREGLERLKKEGPFAVVISDYRMPEMDGITFLQEVKQAFPDVIRIMLSGNADLDTAVKAVNSGQIFRFLTKPCPQSDLKTTLTLAIRQYQLVLGERELLNNTVKGSIGMLIELLSLANGRAYSSGFRIKSIVSQVAQALHLKPLWQYEVAALVSQVGCVAIPSDILVSVQNGKKLSPREQAIFEDHPRIGARLVGRVPRLENVARIIAGQLNDYSEQEVLDHEQPDLIRGAHLLRAALDYDRLIYQGASHSEAIHRLFAGAECYNPEMITALENIIPPKQAGGTIIRVQFDDLIPGMVAAEDIRGHNGALIIEKGQEITWPVLQGLHNFIEHIGIREPISVWYYDQSR